MKTPGSKPIIAPRKKPDGHKIGQPGVVHKGRVFKRLYVGYSPEMGQRYYAFLSPLFGSFNFTKSYDVPVICRPLTVPCVQRIESGLQPLIRSINGTLHEGTEGGKWIAARLQPHAPHS
jgi:hypothetical protein